MATQPTPATVPSGYRDVSVPLAQVVIQGTLLSLALLVLPIVIYWVFHGFAVFWVGLSGITFIAWIAAILVGIILHEGIHALGWKTFGNLRWRDLSFGVDRATLSPYCHAHVPMTAAAYRIGALLPGILIGFLPAIIGIVLADAFLTAMGAFLLSAAIGDFIVLWVLRTIPANAHVLDHPSNAGCYVLESDLPQE
ncbi:MAG: DUF3267 domain-containing protein [Anaerolineae bacterium]|nr:DUF3267 domain-containing protein [Anaerolineae bacterium]MCA9908513.1 DUF3267 domain-containing protein [Anaerolineae bacterium]